MNNASIFASLVLLFSLSFAGEFLCGGVGGIPCTTDCAGHWSESTGDYVSCECPPEGCVCYCPVGGEETQTQTETETTPERNVGEGQPWANAPACEATVSGTCTQCGVINDYSGTVAIQKGNGEWCLGYTDYALQPGDFVVTPGDSKVRIRLFDGGDMDMAPGSQFRFDGLTYLNPPPMLETMGYLTITAVRGVYHYMIQKDRIEQFEIRPNGAVVGIKGTEFVVEAADSYTKVKVLDGTVDFYRSGSDARVLLNEGEYSVLETGASAPNYPQEFNTAGESRWWNDLEGGSCCGTAFILMIVPLLAFVFRSD